MTLALPAQTLGSLAQYCFGSAPAQAAISDRHAVTQLAGKRLATVEQVALQHHPAQAGIAGQALLDHAGQHLMTVNVLGQITWATPQAHALLAKAQVNTPANMDWQQSQLAAQLRHWLSQTPDAQAQLPLHGLLVPISLRMLGREPNGQCLIRLVDEVPANLRVKNAAVLKQELGLTERESEVLYWIANGKTNREVAEILGMSPRTVNKHLELVFPKLGVENRTAAAGIALRCLDKDYVK